LVVELGCWISFLGLFGFELNVLVLGRFVVVLEREGERDKRRRGRALKMRG
jgi:hypothetical protein